MKYRTTRENTKIEKCMHPSMEDRSLDETPRIKCDRKIVNVLREANTHMVHRALRPQRPRYIFLNEVAQHKGDNFCYTKRCVSRRVWPSLFPKGNKKPKLFDEKQLSKLV